MKYVKRILYAGDDAEFLTSINNFFKLNDSEVIVLSTTYTKGALVSSFVENPFHALILDFTCIKDAEGVLSEIEYLKRIDSALGVLCAAVFKDELHRNFFPHVYTLGISLAFIKGCEEDIFLKDISSIAFSTPISFPPFAKAANLFIPLEVGVCSTLTSMSEDEFSLDTDLDTDEGVISTTLPMYEELECRSFVVKRKLETAGLYPMTCSYEMEYPYASPWEDETNENISKETVETWIGLHSPQNFAARMEVLVITSDQKIVSNLFTATNSELVRATYFNSYNEVTSKFINVKRPAMVFFEYSPLTESNMNDISLLVDLINSIPEYLPFIVITNNQSSSNGLQKALRYNFILGSMEPLAPDMFKTLTDMFLKKRGENGIPPNRLIFHAGDTSRVIDLNIATFISSVTEHEVTFYSKCELPCFCVLHFLKPVELYATIIPRAEKLPSKEGYRHYSAIIHGLSENELMALRQIVNQVIYKPDTSFEEIVLDADIPKPQVENFVKETLKEENVNVLHGSNAKLKKIDGALKKLK